MSNRFNLMSLYETKLRMSQEADPVQLGCPEEVKIKTYAPKTCQKR